MSILTKLPEERYDPAAFEGVQWDRTFDLRTARALMWLSQLVYETDDVGKIKRILTGWGLTLLGGDVVSAEVKSVLPFSNSPAIVVAGRGATIVTFRGTDPASIADWITDFDARKNWSGTAEGYQSAADTVFPKIEALINTRPAEHSKIYVTGHSLGGALAVITARHLTGMAATPVEAVYTYGMPRPGSDAFATAYDATGLGMRTYRLVHGNDLVASVAPSEAGFRHVGRYLHVKSGGKFAAAGLAADTNMNEPLFVEGIAREIDSWVHQPIANLGLGLGRLRLVGALVLGRNIAGLRSDPVGIAIELLPPRVRDHVQDSYLAALT